MARNQYDLCNIQQRREFFEECVRRHSPSVVSKEFEENIEFLCSRRLSHEWTNAGCIGFPDNRIIIGSLKTSKKIADANKPQKIGYPIELNYLLELAKSLRTFDNNRINYYIKKLKLKKAFNKISVVSEIKIISKYLARRFEIDFEPGNKKVEREGKSDLAVRFNDEWIYFEITQQELPTTQISDTQSSRILRMVEEELQKGKIIPHDKKIDTLSLDAKRVLSKDWSDRFLHRLRTSPLHFNKWNNLEGIHYIILDRKPDEPAIILLKDTTTVTKRKLRTTVIKEAKQIPVGAKGIIIINSSWYFGSFPGYVDYIKELLITHRFDNEILAVIIWNEFQPGTKHMIIPKDKMAKPMMDFLEIPFQ